MQFIFWFIYRIDVEVNIKNLFYLTFGCASLVNWFLYRKCTWPLIYTTALCFCGILTIIDDWKQSQFLCLWLKNTCFLFNFSYLSINIMIIHSHVFNNATWLLFYSIKICKLINWNKPTRSFQFDKKKIENQKLLILKTYCFYLIKNVTM